MTAAKPPRQFMPLRSGSVSVSEIDGTTGTGSILAPVADDPSLIEQHEATFGFALFADQQSAPAFDFEFQVDGFVLSGVRDPQVTVTGNRHEVLGGVTVGGQESASNGSPYRITVKATDGPDAFQLRVWYLDGSGAEQIFYERGGSGSALGRREARGMGYVGQVLATPEPA